MLFLNPFRIEMKFGNFSFWSKLIYIVLFFVHLLRLGVVHHSLPNYCVHILKPLIFCAYILDRLIHLHKGAVSVLRFKIGGYSPRPNIRTNNGIVLKWSHRHLFRHSQSLLSQDVIQLLLYLLLHIASRALDLTIQLLQLLLQHVHLIYQATRMILAGHLFALQLLLVHMIYRVRSLFQNFVVQITHQDGIG